MTIPTCTELLAALKGVRVPASAPKLEGQYQVRVTLMGKSYLNHGVWNGETYITRCQTKGEAVAVARAVLAGAVFENYKFVSGPEWCPGHPKTPRQPHKNIMAALKNGTLTEKERAHVAKDCGLITAEELTARFYTQQAV